MTEEPKINPVPSKTVDFSPHTYRKLLRNLKHIWANIEYPSWMYYAKKQGKTEEEIEALRGKFEAMKKDAETKIDLLLERVKNMIDNAEKGEKDFDYTITCHSVGSDFSLEEHLRHLQPAVAFSKVFTDPRDVKNRYR